MTDPAAVEGGSPILCDAMLTSLEAIVPGIGKRMEFDPEIAVRLVWGGTEVINLPTKVTYPTDGVSHFDVLWDNVRISGMHTRLFFGMLVRLPVLLWRKLKGA